MSKRKTHEEYIAELAMKNSNIEVIEKYIDSKTPILHRCKIDGYEWMARPAKVLHGQGCPKCAGNARKTTREYIDELSVKNPIIEVIGEYHGANVKTMHRCMVHDIYWEATPTRMLGGSGCVECMKDKIGLSNRKTHEQYINEVKALNLDVVVLGRYSGINTPILHKCLIHDIEWMPQPVSVLRGCGCPQCASEKLHNKLCKTNEQYIYELANTNLNIIAIESYVDALTPILHKCLIDGYEWYARPANILFGQGCPQCSESRGEKIVRQWLNRHNIAYEAQKKFDDCKDNHSLPFDFYLPDYSCCIEYDGRQHFEPVEWFGGEKTFEYTKKHDDIKNEYCKNNNIKLLRIPYYVDVEEELNKFLFI